jgi:transposase
MKKSKLFIGIDVSKKKLDISFLSDPKQTKHQHFIVTNCKKGMRSILTEAKKIGYTLENLVVCFEHTGMYSMPLCFFMQEKQVNYAMVPALEIHRSKGITRGKNDKVDSKDIALYTCVHIHKIEFTTLPEKILMKLKVMLSERSKIIRATHIFKRAKETKEFMPPDIVSDALKTSKKMETFLKKMLKEIDSKIQNLIKSDVEINKKYELACSVPGVGPQTALHLISCTRGFTAFDNWRKLACYAGIAPFEYTSGSSIRGKTKVSHIANIQLKSILNMAALSAMQYDPQIKKYYQKKVAEGKNKMSVINAIRCKLISRVMATVKRGTPYVIMQEYA